MSAAMQIQITRTRLLLKGGVYDESLHPRDEDGKWTDKGGSSKDGSGRSLKQTSVKDLPSELVSALNVKETGTLTDRQRAALDAVNEAILDLDGLPEFKGAVIDNVKLVVASYEPAGAAMSMATGQGQAFMMFNAAFDLGASDMFAPARAGSYSMQVASKILQDGGTIGAAIKAMYKLNTYHELGHLYDKLQGGALTNMVVDSIILAKGSDMKIVEKYITQNISRYAATNPRDTSAEVFSMIMNGARLPKELSHVKDYVYGR